MPINRLTETGGPVDVQETTFALDVAGRYFCNTWEEATANGGAPFDAIVVGAGMYGGYCAEKLYRWGASRNLRVLLLEAGSWVVAEHVQNLPRLGLNVPSATSSDPGTPRERVWGLPWRSHEAFPGLAYAVGGRSLYWGGWCPRLTAADLQRWPAPVAADLSARYARVEREIGVRPSTDFITGDLFAALSDRVGTVIAGVPGLTDFAEAPLAVQGAPPASGLFSFDKFSSLTLLLEAIRDAAGAPDPQRRLFLVPRVHVLRLGVSGGAVRELEVAAAGQPQRLPVAPGCAVVLAASAVESTRLALTSFPTPLMGRNLMVHLRTNLTVRLRRAALSPTLPLRLETAALLVRGEAPQGRFHLQLTASGARSGDSDELLFRMVPDIDLLDDLLASQNAEFVSMTIRGLAEMAGDMTAQVPNTAGSWINLSPYESDEYDMQRAWVELKSSSADEALWDRMDQAALALAQAIADDPANLEYRYDDAWKSQPPSTDTMRQQCRDNLGTTHHESGTLWMGAPGSSVTDSDGRFHHIDNAYAADQSLFPSVGSVNPVLTGLALAGRVATAIV